MSAADDAYAKAEALIAKAKRDEETALNLGSDDFAELERIPPEVAELSRLHEIFLDESEITDLEPIAGLHNLLGLGIMDSRVTNLEPIAGLNGLQWLSFNNTQVDSLKHLAGLGRLKELSFDNTLVDSLQHIAELDELQELSFDNTQVDSLEHIAGLVGLQRLSFENTGISDMRPVKDFESLRVPVFGGLFFKNCAATKLDPDGLGRLSEIEDNAERTKQTLDYLQSLTEWPPAGAATPADRPAAPVFSVPDTGPIIGSGDTMADADAEQAALHDECRRKVRNLLTAISETNQFATLRESAEYYRHTIDRPAPEIAATTLWSAGNALRSVLEAHEANRAEGRINDELTPAIATSLGDLVNTHGIYYLGHPKAAAVERKRREYQQGPKQPELEKVSRQLIRSALWGASAIDYHTQILDTPRSVGPPLPLDADTRDAILIDATTSRAIGAAASMAMGGVVDTTFNLLAAIGRKATIAKARGQTAFADPAVVNWVGTNWHLIERFFVLSTGQNARWLYWIKDLFL